MTTISNSYSSTHNCNLCSKPETETKTEENKEESLWESFCNEVIAPTLEDAAYSYLDENYGTKFAEQKAQRELEATYEEALAKEEAKSNRSLEDIANDAMGDILSDGFNYYCDSHFDTNLTEQKNKSSKKTINFFKKLKIIKQNKKLKSLNQTSLLIY